MENELDVNKYKLILENIKREVLKSQYRAMQAVNTELIYMYWNIGKIISENIIWGNKFVDSLSTDLKMEFPSVQGFSVRNLRNMRLSCISIFFISLFIVSIEYSKLCS